MKRAESGSEYCLFGRSKLMEIPTWATADDEKDIQKQATVELKKKGKVNLKELKRLVSQIVGAKEIEKNIAEMRALGANVSYTSCDVTDLNKFAIF